MPIFRAHLCRLGHPSLQIMQGKTEVPNHKTLCMYLGSKVSSAWYLRGLLFRFLVNLPSYLRTIVVSLFFGISTLSLSADPALILVYLG